MKIFMLFLIILMTRSYKRVNLKIDALRPLGQRTFGFQAFYWQIISAVAISRGQVVCLCRRSIKETLILVVLAFDRRSDCNNLDTLEPFGVAVTKIYVQAFRHGCACTCYTHEHLRDKP